MKMAKPSLLDVYKFLPQTNCGECGEVNCMSFASKILDRKFEPTACPPLVKDAQYKEKFESLKQLVVPPVKEIVIGEGKNSVKIGGKEVMYRHELTFHNQTGIAIDVSDTDPEEKIIDRCKKTGEYKVERIGDILTLNLIAVRCASGDPKKFEEAVATVVKHSSYPMILCSYDPSVLGAALRKPGVAESRPLLYAATKENWQDMVVLAKRYNCPLVAFSPNNLADLKSLVVTIESAGVNEIVLDPGSYTAGSGLSNTINNFVMIRRSSIKREDKGLNYPILGIPAMVWLNGGEDPVTSYEEAYVAAIMMARSADLLIMHTLQPWSVLPVTTLRQNIYTDPRKPVAVDSGLRKIGKPDKNSPVLVTTNFALTYYTVANDIESQETDCYLIVANTGGLAVEVSVAGGQFTANSVKELLESSKVGEMVNHKKMIIPQLAARLRGDLEDETKWDVIVGPRDSSQIKEFISKNWNAPEG